MIKKKRKYNTNLIKETLSYSVKDITELFGIHKRTIQQWFKEGLPKIDSKKPYLVLGINLKDFIKKKQQNRKKKCKENEFYCCKCREPRKSWNNFVDVKILNEKILLIVGICSQCNITINKIFSIKKLAEIKEIFMVQKIHNKDILGFINPIVNTDLKE